MAGNMKGTQQPKKVQKEYATEQPGLDTLPQINTEAHRGPHIEDGSLKRSPSQLPC